MTRQLVEGGAGRRGGGGLGWGQKMTLADKDLTNDDIC